MHSDEWIEKELRYQRDLLYRILALLTREGHEIEEIEQAVRAKLSFIKIAIGGSMPVGPVTLTVGDNTKVATVLGFDQNGAPFTIDFAANPVTWVDDNEAAVQDAPAAERDPLNAVAVGVANLTATCAGFTDTETVTVVAAPPKLSSIKVSID